MRVKAKLNNLRISPRKVRLVADLIRGLDVSDAQAQLSFLIKKPAEPVLKLLNSAVANAKHNFDLEDTNLYISEIFVSEGPTLKRIMPRAMGSAFYIRKRISHITLFLEERQAQGKTEEKVENKTEENKEEEKTEIKPKAAKKEKEQPKAKKVSKSVKKEEDKNKK